MPLLYVDGGSLENGNVLGGSSDSGGVDAILEEVVHMAIREVLYEDGDEAVDPIVLPFRGLELQGDDNSVLYVVGNNVNDESQEKENNPILRSDEDDEDDGVIIVDDWDTAGLSEMKGPSAWELLETLVLNIQHKLENDHGLSTCWPLDKPQGEEVVLYDDPMIAAIKEKQRKWRPRVPFVRLPKDFYQDLDFDIKKRKNGSGGDGGEEEDEPTVMDVGLDGISPLFWYEAWGEEEILVPPGVRMPSVAVYRRMVPGGGEAESSFYVPTSSDGPQTWNGGAGVDDGKSGSSMDLPVGDAKLRARERREKAKAMERLGEEEQRAEREWEEGKTRWMDEMNVDGNDEGNTLVDDDSFAQFNVGMETGEVTVEGDAAYSTPWIERGVDDSLKPVEEDLPEEPIAFEDASIPVEEEKPKVTVLPSDKKPRRDLPSIEDNPVFQRLWKKQAQISAKGQNTAVALDGTPPESDAPLPPYPSDPHFTGAWRVVTSPLGTEIDSIDAESKASDNFILRVDGRVMGGPVLDTQYQHKAAGGEWKMFQAVRKSNKSDDGSSVAPPVTQTRLRIRLLVPPEKERVMVLEGEVTRLPGTGDPAASPSPDGWTRTSGGVVDSVLQDMDDVKSQSAVAKGDSVLYCGGEAWMEDAEGGGNRRRLGPFSLMKLKTIERKNLIYTVDVSKPKSEGEDSEDEDSEDN